MTQISSSPHHQSLDTLTVPDISFTGHDIRLVVEDYDIHHSSVRLDSTRLYIAVLLNKEEIGFSDQRLEHVSNGGLFTEDEKKLINQVVEKLLGRPLSTHDFTEERLSHYIRAGVEKDVAEKYLLMLTRPYSEWQESDWEISNYVETLLSTDVEGEKEGQKIEACIDTLMTIFEQVDALNANPTSIKQNKSLLRIASACIDSNGAFPDFPLTPDDMHLISDEQDGRLTEEQIKRIRLWIIAQDNQLPEALPPVPPQPLLSEELPDELVWEFEDEDLGMLDTEYAALLAEGINPATQERLWDLENIKYKLSYLVTQIYKESYEIGTEEFPVLLKETAISIAEAALLLPSDRLEEINSDFRKLTEAEFTKIDTWIEIRFGAKLSQFPELIRIGIDPVTLEKLST